MIKDKPQTEKKTTRTGRRIGMKDRCRISISVNDPDRCVSFLWEHIKKHFSRKKITAAELAKTVLLRGITSVLEEMEAEYQRNAEQIREAENARQQTFDFK